jgi:phage/plasmid-associated DNA primase
MTAIINPHLQKFNEFLKSLPAVPTKDKRANVYDAARGNWVIDENNAGPFIDVYDAAIASGVTLHTYERAEERGLFVDLDIIQNVRTRVYSTEFFVTIATDMYRQINQIVPGIKGPSRVVVTRRQEISPADDPGKYKEGVHILFPSLRMNKALRVHILETFKADFADIFEEAIAASLGTDGYEEASDPTTWVDTHAARVPVNLPGSCKPGNSKKPHVIAYTGEVRLIDSRRNGVRGEARPIMIDNNTAFCCLVLKAPGYSYEHFAMDVKSSSIDEATEALLEADDDDKIDADNFTANHPEAAYIRELIDILPSKYYDEYESWVRVLTALASMGQRYKCIALQFSKKSKKFDSSSFDTTWMSVSQSGRTTMEGFLTKRSIIYWARMENPSKFATILEKSYFKLLVHTIMTSGGAFTHANHAKMLASLMSHKFVFAKKLSGFRSSNPCWFEFITPEDSHRYGEVWKWRPDPDGDFLGLYIMDQYTTILNQAKLYIADQKDKVNSTTDPKNFKAWDIIEKSYIATIKKIGDEGNISKIIKSAQRLFKRREFMDELDREEDYIGVANGVLHVGEKVTLIARHHEHPIYLSTVASYQPYDETSAAVRHVQEIFHQIYPEQDVYDYVWFMSCTGLDRRPVTGKALFLIGGGGNGKSISMSFIQNAMGLNLCASMKMALLTAKHANKASDADSAFMQAKGKTLLIFDEGSGNDVLNSEKVKNLVNCNAQTARELFSVQENFFLHANSICSTNHPPTIRSTDTDHGFWRRVLFYTAKSKFVENPDPNRPNEHKVDTDIESRLIKDPVYLNAVLSIMAHYYERFAKEYKRNIGKVPCPTIMAETQKFREGQDKCFKYCLERIVISPRSTIMSSDLGADYSNWAMTQFNDQIIASKAEVYLSDGAIGVYKAGHEYIGIRIRHGPVKKSQGEMQFSEFMALTEEERKEYRDKAAELREGCDEEEEEEMTERTERAERTKPSRRRLK